ncbi:hypothetical protein IAT38_004177 [Cryptococcus sp. DSM 104549]
MRPTFARALSHSPALHAPPKPPARKSRPMLGKFTVTPVELFRVNPGPRIQLRDYAVQHKAGKMNAYDLHLSPDGLVLPIKGDTFYSKCYAATSTMGENLLTLSAA